MLIELTLFWNEDKLFVPRIKNTLSYADRIFIAEGDASHSGKIKRAFRVPALIKALDPELQARVVHVPVFLSKSGESNPFKREAMVRDAPLTKVKELGYSDETLVIVSDFDEFTNPARVKKMIRFYSVLSWFFGGIRLRQKLTYFTTHHLVDESWNLPFLSRIRYLNRFPPNQVRHHLAKKKRWLTTPFQAGWHHSYLGDAKFIKEKLDSFAESNLDWIKALTAKDIERALQQKKDLFGRDMRIREIIYKDHDPIPALIDFK